jgi:hypothetical protein
MVNSDVKRIKETWLTSQNDAPAFQPLFLACDKQPASVFGPIYPLLASEAVPGLPMTTLSRPTPFAAISNTELCGKLFEDLVSNP